MAYDRYVPEFTDKDGQIYGVMDEEAREKIANLNSAITQLNDNVITESAGPAPIVSFKDGADGMPLRNLSVAVEPVQDLHGYDHPWPAGGGRNLLDASIANTETKSGVTMTVNKNATGAVTSIVFNGTATGAVAFTIGSATLPAGSYVFSTFSGNTGAIDAFYVNYSGIINAGSSDVIATISEEKTTTANVSIASGQSINNVLFYPMIRLATEADSTFEPYSNICPISGWTGAKVTRTGKNLLYAGFKSETKNGLTFTLNDDNSVTVNGTATATVTYSHYTGALCKNIFRAGETYTLSGGSVFGSTIIGYIQVVCVEKETGNVISIVSSRTNMTYTFAEDAILDGVYISFRNGQTFNNVTVKPQFELSSTATTYEPYQGETYNITFPTEAGTVYGGTLDAVARTLTVDRAMVDLGTLSYGKDTSVNRFNTGGITNAVQSDTTHSKAYCSMYGLLAAGQTAQRITGFTITNTSGLYIYDSTQENATADEFKAYVSGQYMCYKITNPTTITGLDQATIATLLGQNNIFADTGNVSVDYPADTKLYIDKKLAELQALILENI